MSRDLPVILKVHDRLGGLYADPRFESARKGGQLRALGAAMIWAWGAEGMRGKEWRNRVAVLSGLGHPNDGWTWQRWQMLVREDVPRFEPVGLHGKWLCEAPMIRRDTCDSPKSSMGGRITDRASGEWRIASFCSRHKADGYAAFEAERQLQARGGIPTPLPNTGGVLPCHMPGAKWWATHYEWASPGWTIPDCGIRADQWPERQAVQVNVPPVFSLIEGEGRRVAGDPSRIYFGGQEMPAIGPPPALALIQGGDD